MPLIRPAIVIVVILRLMTALSAFAAIFAATGGGPGTATEILNLYAYRTSFTELNLGYGAALAMVLLTLTLTISFMLFRHPARAMSSRRWRTIGLTLIAALLLSVWIIPVRMGAADLVQDRARCACVSAAVFFEPTLAELSRSAVRRQHASFRTLISSVIVAGSATLLTMLFAVPAAYALARLDLPAKRAGGFYVLATQMLAAGRA